MSTALLREARQRIQRIRKIPVRFHITRDGQPLEGARVQAKLQRHDFLFGAVCYHYGRFDDPKKDQRFSELFAPLLNYTMMPVHWNWYEKERHQYNEPYVGNLVDWAQKHQIKRKMHALIWHECCPDWVLEGMDIEALYVERIRYLMERYKGRFDFHDIINESTVYQRFDNPVSRWIHRKGKVEVAKFGVDLARSIEPEARLIYGDWNVHGQEYLDFLRDLRERDVGIDCLGLQSHMHRDLWTQEETLRVMDEAARYKWPLHFPEVSICSGRPIGEMSYLPGAVNRFLETEEDLIWQAQFAEDFYTLVYSHPATEAISWFDFVDHRWLGAPAGLVDDDLNPKPVYQTLMRLIHQDWSSQVELKTDSSGICQDNLVFGEYQVQVEKDGQTNSHQVAFHRPSFYEGSSQPLHVELILT